MYLCFATLLAKSADDKLMFFLFFLKTGFDTGDNLHEMSNPVFWKK